MTKEWNIRGAALLLSSNIKIKKKDCIQKILLKSLNVSTFCFSLKERTGYIIRSCNPNHAQHRFTGEYMSEAAFDPVPPVFPNSWLHPPVQLALSRRPLNSAFQLILHRQVISTRTLITSDTVHSSELLAMTRLLSHRQSRGRCFSPSGAVSLLEDTGLSSQSGAPQGAPAAPKALLQMAAWAQCPLPACRGIGHSQPLASATGASHPPATTAHRLVLLSAHHSCTQPYPLGTEQHEMNTGFVFTGVRGLPAFTFQEFRLKSDQARLRFHIKVCLFLYSILTVLLKRWVNTVFLSTNKGFP